MTVHFICRGNTHRSFMADAYLKSLGISGLNVISSGTVAEKYRKLNEPIMREITRFLEDHGLAAFTKKRADQLTQERVDTSDINICMNQVVKTECDAIVKMPETTIIWNIVDTNEGSRVIKPKDDPYKYTEEIYQEIKSKVDELVEHISLSQ